MGEINPLRLRSGESGSVYTSSPSATPHYQLPGTGSRRYETMARLGVTSIPSFAKFDGDFERYRTALEGNGYIDFLLQSAVENFNEIVQVDEVLGDTYVPWLYGQQAPTFTYAGTLLNTQQDKWRSAMHYLYKDVFRGTQLAKRKMMVRLQYDTVLVEGAMISFVQSLSANNETAVNFNFQLLVRRFIDLSPPGTDNLPTTVMRPFEAVILEEQQDLAAQAVQSRTTTTTAPTVNTPTSIDDTSFGSGSALDALNTALGGFA